MFGLTVLHMPCCSLLTKIRRLQLFFQFRVFICPFPPLLCSFLTLALLDSSETFQKPCFATCKCQFSYPLEKSLPLTPFENQRIGKSR